MYEDSQCSIDECSVMQKQAVGEPVHGCLCLEQNETLQLSEQVRPICTGPGRAHACLTVQAFAENMLLCGGGSSIPGLGGQFAAEVQAVCLPSLQPAMCTCPDYMPESTLRYSSWMGAAILSKVSWEIGLT